MIDSVVVVSEQDSESCDVPPVDVGVSGAGLVRQGCGRLTDDLE